ncbi:MAG: hypothetical protein J6O41_08185, partial [Clostridia bacterium]|nr:hypothetical protein [Clostridia bacterium]
MIYDTQDKMSILKDALRECEPGLRKTFFEHFDSFDLSLKTYCRVLASEYNEEIVTDGYIQIVRNEIEKILLKDFPNNKNLNNMIRGLIVSPAFSGQDMRDIFMTINHIVDLISEEYEKRDFPYSNDKIITLLVFNIIPWKFEEYSIYNTLTTRINDFNTFNMISCRPYQDVIKRQLLAYIDNENKEKTGENEIAGLITLTLRSIQIDPIKYSKVYLYYIRLHHDLFMSSKVKNIIFEMEKSNIDTLDIINGIQREIDVNESDNLSLKYFEGDFTDTISISTNNYQIFGESGTLDGTELLNDYSKLVYKIEELTLDEIVMFFGEEIRIDFELNEDMYAYLMGRIKPQTLT